MSLYFGGERSKGKVTQGHRVTVAFGVRCQRGAPPAAVRTLVERISRVLIPLFVVHQLKATACGGGSATYGRVSDQCSCSSWQNQCQLSADHLYQPIYSGPSSIDVQFNSSASSSLTSQHPPRPLARWKPVSNIPERWSKEMTDTAAAAGRCEFMM